MTTQPTTEELTIRYEEALKLIRDGKVPTTEELQWFAETSMSFASTLGALFTDFARVQEQASKLINAITTHVDPKTTDTAVSEAVVALAIVIGAVTEEDLFDTDGKDRDVDIDNIEIWKYNKHRNVGGAKRVAMVGYISVGDLVYTPLP